MQVLSEGNCLHPLEYHRYLAAADHAKAVFAVGGEGVVLHFFVLHVRAVVDGFEFYLAAANAAFDMAG